MNKKLSRTQKRKNNKTSSVSVNTETVNDCVNGKIVSDSDVSNKTNEITYEKTSEILLPRNFIVTFEGVKWCLLCDRKLFANINVLEHTLQDRHQRLLNLHFSRVAQLRAGKVQTASETLKETNNGVIDIDKNSITNLKYTSDRNSNVAHSKRDLDTMKGRKENLCFDSNIDKIKKSFEDFYRVGISISFEKCLSYCRKCDVFIELNYEIIYKHISNHQGTDESNCDEMSQIITELKNCIDVGGNGNGRKFEKHNNAEENADDTNEEIVSKKNNPIGTFYVSTITKIVTTISTYVMINNEYCIHEYSLLVLTRNAIGDIQCEICLKIFKKGKEEAHKESHVKDISKMTVLTELKHKVFKKQKEFVRQIRPHVFHCGFCNKVETSWNRMIQHSNCDEHYEAKMASYCRLQQLKRFLK